MLRSDGNDQSTGPFHSVPQAPRQLPEEESYQQERPPHQPTLGENMYGPEAQFYQSLAEESVHTAWQENAPLWNTSDKLSVAPAVRWSARGVRPLGMLALMLVMASVLGGGLFAGWGVGRNSVSDDTTAKLREAAIAKVRPAVVQVNVSVPTSDGEMVVRNTGVIVNKQGYIVTNNHVVWGSEAIEVVFSNGDRIENVQLAGTDASDDLAILKIDPPANMVVATLGDSSKLQVGEDVLAIGNPLGTTQTVTHGIISAPSHSVSEYHGPIIPNAIQTDAPINPGNSGGALVDLQGNVIGIPTLAVMNPAFNAPANGLGFAIPINQVKRIVPQIIQDGSVTHTGRAALGIHSRDLSAMDDASVDQGVLVLKVEGDGPSAESGLQPGDVIVTIGRQKIENEISLGDALATKAPGDTISVNIYRDEQPLTFTITLGELQAD